MSKSRTSSSVKNKYNAKAYDRILVVVPKGRKDEVTAYVERLKKDKPKLYSKLSVNGLINRLLQSELGYTAEQWKRRAVDNDE